MDANHNQTFIAFDLETTGLDPLNDRIVEMAGVKFTISGEVSDIFETRTDPGIPIPRSATAIHRVTEQMVVGKPSPLTAWETLLDWTDTFIFVAHNASFDASFIKNLRSTHPKMKQVQFIDTLELCRNQYPEARSHSLDTLIPREDSHHALSDAKAVAQLLVQLAQTYPSKKIPTSYIRNIKDIKEDAKTQRQMDYIADLGGDPARVKTKQEASQYIDQLKAEESIQTNSYAYSARQSPKPKIREIEDTPNYMWVWIIIILLALLFIFK